MQIGILENGAVIELFDKEEREAIYDICCHSSHSERKVHESSFSIRDFLEEQEKDLSLNY